MIKALILVDIQNDFLPGGALAVPDGEQVIPVANQLIELGFDIVVATQDWHPAGHGSFASMHSPHQIGEVIELDGLPQVLWPDHCVQGTEGAKFADSLQLPDETCVFRKGTDPQIDSYSGFFDNGHRKATGLGGFLKEQDVNEVHLVGLATDYCVKFTALDAKQLGFDTHLILAGCRGVNLNEGDVQKAIDELNQAGVVIEM